MVSTPSCTSLMHGPISFSTSSLACLRRNNRQKISSAYQAREKQVHARPVHLKIELTNYCNLACPICPHSSMKRPQGNMSAQLFRKIIRESTPELEFAYLHHLGESLFHPQVGELIAYGKLHGIRMGLSTNATILNESKARAILENGLDFLVISLDAALAETYQQIRINADYRKTIQNIDRLFDLKEKISAPTHIIVQLIVINQTPEELEQFRKKWNGFAVLKKARDWGGQVPIGSHSRNEGFPLPCKMPWTELTVLWDGSVVPCANVVEHHNLLGNLDNQSLDEIWNGNLMKKFRKQHLLQELSQVDICSHCQPHYLDCQSFLECDQFESRIRHYQNASNHPIAGLS